MTTVKEHNMGFKPSMVRAILDGRKTMTRRLITPRNSYYDGGPVSKARWAELDWASQDIYADNGPSPSGNPGPYLHVPDKTGGAVHRIYPRYQPGDGLWGRETHALENLTDGERIVWQADRAARWRNSDEIFWLESNYQPAEWRPSIHMFRWASRINLEITAVRVERLQDISEEDAKAEGCAPAWLDADDNETVHANQSPTYRRGFARLWRDINGIGSWALNPWVWCISFRRLDADKEFPFKNEYGH